ncbi:DMT family transporter [Oceanospirillum beijerinckii]|uniref:DMT family transporter n=1 Tax=Oceanospirillum beijerinckii TaxID=64976 RepID=UPI000423FED2|nr:DMT family transporter [Oceanospirillum beijerinckii]MAC46919.1 EamA/RhaT family transporter [Oceanospirillum sp.]
MGSRQPLDLLAVGIMLVFCLVMASQQVVLKAVAEDITAVFQIALRSGIAGVLLLALIVLQRQKMPLADENRIPAVLIGVLFSFEYLFLGEALQYTSAGHATVFLYTSPIFAALGLHWKVAAERMSGLQWLGILLAFGGVMLAFLGKGAGVDSLGAGGSGNSGLSAQSMLWGDFLALLAGASWGATTVVVRSTGLGVLPARQTLLYQLIGAFIILTLWAWMTDKTSINFTSDVAASLVFHGVVVSFLAFLVWFWLLTRYKASQLGVLSFLTPVYGVLLGSWLLGEPLESHFITGAVLIIAGILVVSCAPWLSGFKARRVRA